jgi:aspartyl-tRNA(Asn)/glutamyl-tRNA(Gln) amidotransferase subunit B
MDSKYKVTIGLEVHAELKTLTKMFCACLNNPDEEKPNTNICPVCMAHPGTLPTANKQAIENVIKVGLAIDGTIANFSEFDRKNYFYPDIPKGYQISQYKYPIVSGGVLNNVAITRIHLEEDTANNKHDRGDFSLIDFNRAGVPLMELVTEPVIHSAKEAGDFGRELQLLLRTLGVSDANMEKGEMRVELNLSVSDTDKFGTKVEVKNINSFKAVEKAAEFEIKRHIELLESGKGSEIVQETRGWDEKKQITFSQRTKENSEDYRYFPEPDLPKMQLHEMFDLEKIKENLPELPWNKRERYKKEFGIKDEDIEILVNDRDLADFFENVIKVGNIKGDLVKKTANYILSDLNGVKTNLGEKFILPKVESFAKIINLVGENKINSRGAKDLIGIVSEGDIDPEVYAKDNGLIQEFDEGKLKAIAEKIIADNPGVVDEYKAGKEKSIQFLVGQFMRESRGSANPQLALKILQEILK